MLQIIKNQQFAYVKIYVRNTHTSFLHVLAFNHHPHLILLLTSFIRF